MRFIDLFAGLGGFNLALSKLGHECVFACEIDESLRQTYFENFGLKPASDIRTIRPKDVPKHDILCAGFPCQPFSKAGEQEGFQCPTNGDLFAHVMRIVRHRKPKYVLLENVGNLAAHNGGMTWKSIERRIKSAGYSVTSKRLSPHHFGIPQIRERLIIVASRKSLKNFSWPEPPIKIHTSIEDVLSKQPANARPLSDNVTRCLGTWQNFLDAIPPRVKLPPCPIWTMEFGATYPFEESTPYARRKSLGWFRGSFGQKLSGLTMDEKFALLPSHARIEKKTFPDWKIRFIQANRAFYAENKKWIDKWLPQIREFPSSLQKLEWNCTGDERDIWRYVIQFRASGVRVKRRTTAPSLIAMTTTQIPIIAWEHRYMTQEECAKLQSMDSLALPSRYESAFAALGNAINVEVITLVARNLLAWSARKRANPRVDSARRRKAA